MVGVPRNQVAIPRLDEMFFARDSKPEPPTHAVPGLLALVVVSPHMITLFELHEGDHHPLSGRPHNKLHPFELTLLVILFFDEHVTHPVNLPTSSRIRSRILSEGSLKIGTS
jgi:hypothetical protein